MNINNLLVLGVLDELYSCYDFIKSEVEHRILQCNGFSEMCRVLDANNTYKKSVQVLSRWVVTHIEFFSEEYDIPRFTAKQIRIELNIPYCNRKKDKMSDRIIMGVCYQPFDYFLQQLETMIIQGIKTAHLNNNNPRSYLVLSDVVSERIAERVMTREKNTFIDADDSNKPVVDDNVLFLYKNLLLITCNQKKHIIVPDIIYRELVDHTGIIALPVHRCKDCGKVFIGEKTLQLYQEQYGRIFVQAIREETINQLENNSYDFMGESKLHSLGYNVVEGEMTTEERQYLLTELINTKRITYFEACRDIEHAISLFENHPSFQLAVGKWKNDLKFLGNIETKKILSENDEGYTKGKEEEME